MIWWKPDETEIDFLKKRNAYQQRIIENSHANNERLRLEVTLLLRHNEDLRVALTKAQGWISSILSKVTR